MNRLNQQEIDLAISKLKNWRLEGAFLVKDLRFADFDNAWRFMQCVAKYAKEQDHHPNWYNVYNEVQIRLSSHDADGITSRDFKLATSIDGALENIPHENAAPAKPN